MDVSLLRSLNGQVEVPVIHQFCWLVDQPWAPALLFLLIIAMCARKDRWLEIPGAILAVIVADPVCARVLKPMFARVRPCNEYEWVAAPFGCGEAFSMPSCHATNLFAIAMVINRPWAFLLAAFVAIARSISGVHYPTDLVAGAVLGLAIGWGIRLAVNSIQVTMKRSKRKKPTGRRPPRGFA
jgi:membrane-associated phospholipid phosphatase